MLSFAAPKKETQSKELIPRFKSRFSAAGFCFPWTEFALESLLPESFGFDWGVELAEAIGLIPFKRIFKSTQWNSI